MAVGEFDYIETKAYPKAPKDAQPIDVKVYTLKGQTAQGKFGLEVAAKTLEFFSSYFDIAYPLPKVFFCLSYSFVAHGLKTMAHLDGFDCHSRLCCRRYFTILVYARSKQLNLKTAMENWGLVTYREICLLFDEKTSSAANKQRIAYGLNFGRAKNM